MVERGRREGRERRDDGRFRFENFGDEARLRRGLERPPAGGHLVQEGAQREDVGARVRWQALDLFGRHVRQRADEGALRRVRSWRGREHRERLPGSADGVLREAEIEQLGPGRGEHHVPRLQIAMDDAEPVRGLERVRDFNAEAEDLAQRQRAACQTGGQRLTLEQFEHQILDVVLAADVVQAADVRVVERGDGFGLTGEARAELGIRRQFRREDLQRHAAVQARIAGPIHLAHATRAKQGEHFVGAEPLPGLQRHAARLYAPLIFSEPS